MEGDWVKVYLDADEVFVSADYVEVSSELGTAITMIEGFLASLKPKYFYHLFAGNELFTSVHLFAAFFINSISHAGF